MLTLFNVDEWQIRVHIRYMMAIFPFLIHLVNSYVKQSYTFRFHFLFCIQIDCYDCQTSVLGTTVPMQRHEDGKLILFSNLSEMQMFSPFLISLDPVLQGLYEINDDIVNKSFLSPPVACYMRHKLAHKSFTWI